MSPKSTAIQPIRIRSIGILGFGAFGRLIAEHLHPYFTLFACDPALTAEDERYAHVRFGNISAVAGCDLVILAVPVSELSSALRGIRPHLRKRAQWHRRTKDRAMPCTRPLGSAHRGVPAACAQAGRIHRLAGGARQQAAIVQGITHLIASVLVRMEPLPTQLTTASFDHLVQATEMVRQDAASVFLAIERDNPYAAEVREQFFLIAEAMRSRLDQRD